MDPWKFTFSSTPTGCSFHFRVFFKLFRMIPDRTRNLHHLPPMSLHLSFPDSWPGRRALFPRNGHPALPPQVLKVQRLVSPERLPLLCGSTTLLALLPSAFCLFRRTAGPGAPGSRQLLCWVNRRRERERESYGDGDVGWSVGMRRRTRGAHRAEVVPLSCFHVNPWMLSTRWKELRDHGPFHLKPMDWE